MLILLNELNLIEIEIDLLFIFDNDNIQCELKGDILLQSGLFNKIKSLERIKIRLSVFSDKQRDKKYLLRLEGQLKFVGFIDIIF